MEKIFISGTGRCGTTFLILLFTLLDFDTGFDKNNYQNFIFNNCNSGMERIYTDNHQILKNPLFLNQIEDIYNNCNIKYFILPIRDINESAYSRKNINDKNIIKKDYNNDDVPGGFVECKTVETQILLYEKSITHYIIKMTQYNIPTIFIDFNKMINDFNYLYNMILPILNDRNITLEEFKYIYYLTSLHQNKKLVYYKLLFSLLSYIFPIYLKKKMLYSLL